MSLTIDYLEEIQESGKLEKPVLEVIDILLRSINDWPVGIENFDDYEKDIHRFLKSEVGKAEINAYLPNFSMLHAWEAESLHQLADVFDYYDEGKSFKEILIDLENNIGANNSLI